MFGIFDYFFYFVVVYVLQYWISSEVGFFRFYIGMFLIVLDIENRFFCYDFVLVFVDSLWGDVMFFVISCLYGMLVVGFVDGVLYGIGDFVGVEDD